MARRRPRIAMNRALPLRRLLSPPSSTLASAASASAIAYFQATSLCSITSGSHRDHRFVESAPIPSDVLESFKTVFILLSLHWDTYTTTQKYHKIKNSSRRKREEERRL